MYFLIDHHCKPRRNSQNWLNFRQCVIADFWRLWVLNLVNLVHGHYNYVFPKRRWPKTILLYILWLTNILNYLPRHLRLLGNEIIGDGIRSIYDGMDLLKETPVPCGHLAREDTSRDFTCSVYLEAFTIKKKRKYDRLRVFCTSP